MGLNTNRASSVKLMFSLFGESSFVLICVIFSLVYPGSSRVEGSALKICSSTKYAPEQANQDDSVQYRYPYLLLLGEETEAQKGVTDHQLDDP